MRILIVALLFASISYSQEIDQNTVDIAFQKLQEKQQNKKPTTVPAKEKNDEADQLRTQVVLLEKQNQKLHEELDKIKQENLSISVSLLKLCDGLFSGDLRIRDDACIRIYLIAITNRYDIRRIETGIANIVYIDEITWSMIEQEQREKIVYAFRYVLKGKVIIKGERDNKELMKG